MERKRHLNWALQDSHLPEEKGGKTRTLRGEGLARANNNSSG